MTELDNDDKPGGLMKVNVNIVQVSVALNQGMISSYHLEHSRVGQEALLTKCVLMHACVCVAVCSVFRVQCFE